VGFVVLLLRQPFSTDTCYQSARQASSSVPPRTLLDLFKAALSAELAERIDAVFGGARRPSRRRPSAIEPLGSP
jgi:hypothetical protein